MFTYETASHFLITNLKCDIELHNQSKYEEIGRGFDEFDANLPRTQESRFHKLHIALVFWDAWIDARNHNWQYYDPIIKSYWPELAQYIINDIEKDREISNPLILQQFDFQK